MSEKYDRKSPRWQDWDYRWSAAYFITICTLKKERFLGEIVDGKMKLSRQGFFDMK